jgi:large subunit ribosomal protein L4
VKIKVSSFAGTDAADIELNDEVFGLDPRADILHRVVTWQLEKRRETARGTRERADVARTGKKFTAIVAHLCSSVVVRLTALASVTSTRR